MESDMKGALIIYYSRSGNTKKMAELIAEGIKKEGVDALVKDIKDLAAEELFDYEAIVIGSPTYYGTMAAQVKQLLDDSVKFHGRLEGKIGAAFASSGNIAGGNETTILDILNALLIHGMIIQGDPQGDHYGPVAVAGAPDARSTKECIRLGVRLTKLAKMVSG